MKVYVLGGGLTGLTAAYKLITEHKANVVVIEKNSFLGGLTATIPVSKGQSDLSPHCFRTYYPEVASFIDELVGDLKIKVPYSSKIMLLNRELDYPPIISDLLKNLPPSIIGKIAIDYMRLIVQDILTKDYSRFDLSYEHWLKARVGKTIYSLFFEPITKKTWHSKPQELHYSFASNRVPLERPLKNLLSIFKKEEYSEEHPYAPFNDFFFYFKGGTGKIIERLAQKIREQGGDIWTHTEVKHICFEDNKIKSLILQKKDEKIEVENPDFVINTLPLNKFFIHSNADEHINDAARSLCFSSLSLVYVLAEQQNAIDAQWIFYPQRDIIFSRLSKNFEPSLVPQGHEVITAEVACFENDSIWNMPDEDVTLRVIIDLERVTNLNKKNVVGTRVIHYYPAYPIYLQNFVEAKERLIQFISQVNNLITLGRQGEFDYINMDECIKRVFATPLLAKLER